MKLYNGLLKLFVVSEIIFHSVIDIILELLLLVNLLLNLFLDFLLRHLQPLKFVSQILYNELQILIDNFKVFYFVLHNSLLLIQTLDLFLSRSNFVLQLFDLVIKDKLEFFKFHCPLVKIVNFDLFVCNSGLAFLQLTHLTFNL